MSDTRNIDDYIKEVSVKHNYYYDYSLVSYVNAHTKIKIICPLHGVFEQEPLNHKRCGCRKCGKLLNEKIILNRFLNIHGDKYDYSKFKYLGMYQKSTMICSIHGEFEQLTVNHLIGKGCPKCASNVKKDSNYILEKIKNIHNDKYDYSLSNFKRTKDKIKIICPTHGLFEQILNNHMRGNGCPLCDESKGERCVERYLIDNNIIFERQKKFKDCKNKRLLSFDFYLPNYNLCIEYDGAQHFIEVLNWNNLDYTKENDEIKNNFCLKNDINLYRISYKDNVIEKLNKKIKKNKKLKI